MPEETYDLRAYAVAGLLLILGVIGHWWFG